MLDVCNMFILLVGLVLFFYFNIVMLMMGNLVMIKVMIFGMLVLIKLFKIIMSNGDQLGVNGGVVSGKIMGFVEFIMGSMKVKLEGNLVVCMGDIIKQNDGNVVGVVLVLSQVKVMIMSQVLGLMGFGDGLM